MIRLAAVAAALVALATSCELGAGDDRVGATRDSANESPARFSERGIALTVPGGWTVAGFSTTVFPARLAVASYPIPDEAVEGDCGGLKAVEDLPNDGALVILIDYGTGGAAGFAPRPRRFRLSEGRFEAWECFGESTMFRFRDRGRALQAHVALGPNASSTRVQNALGLLDSLMVTSSERQDASAQAPADAVDEDRDGAS